MKKSRRILSQHLIETAIKLSDEGLNVGTAGNLSVRYRDGFLITPSAMPYHSLSVDDIVFVSLGGSDSDTPVCKSKNHRKPSSEWRFHRDILAAKPEVNAVIHTHSAFATALACCGKEIPAFHYMIALFGGDTIRCAPYALFGTQALSDNAIAALQDRRACLLANHGMIICGDALETAFHLTHECETLCQLYWRTLCIGTPDILTGQDMDLVMEKFKTYRQS